MGKTEEALKVWSDAIQIDGATSDIFVIQELHFLVENNSVQLNEKGAKVDENLLTVETLSYVDTRIEEVVSENEQGILRKIESTNIDQNVSADSENVLSVASNLKNVDGFNISKKTTSTTELCSIERKRKESLKATIINVHRESIGTTDKHAIKPFYLQAMRKNLPHVCGEEIVDDLVCLAYINVNSGNWDIAFTIFQLLSDYRKDLPSVCIGIGSVYAIRRQYDEAIVQFSQAIALDASLSDAWKRRGQTRAAKNQIKGALKDMTRAISLDGGSDMDSYFQRGLVYHQNKNYKMALLDFRSAQQTRDNYNNNDFNNISGINKTKITGSKHSSSSCNIDNKHYGATLLNYIGMCEGQLGNVDASLQAHRNAVKIESSFKEAHLNMALMYKEVGNWKDANIAFNKALNCDKKKTFFHVYIHRGMMLYQLGRPGAALKDLTCASNLLYSVLGGANSSNHTDAAVSGSSGDEGNTLSMEEKTLRKSDLIRCLHKAAMCYQSLGQYHKTVGLLDQVLSIQPTHHCWFHREIALICWSLLDTELCTYSLDTRIDARLKDGCCKQHLSMDQFDQCLQLRRSASNNNYSKIGFTTATTNYLPYKMVKKPTDIPCLQKYSLVATTIAATATASNDFTTTRKGDREAVSTMKYDDLDGTYLSEGVGGGEGNSSNVHITRMQCESQKRLLLQMAAPFLDGSWVQLDTPGFLPNRRQHRMFGLAVLQMSLALRKHMSLIALEGSGLTVPNAAASSSSSNRGSVDNCKARSNTSSTSAKVFVSSSSATGTLRSGKRGEGANTHSFNWRDMYDIAVRWRQLSEPSDPVWWIDRFPLEAFQEGFGLQTPIVNGQLFTVRYAPYYSMAFERLRQLLLEEGYYTVADKHQRLQQQSNIGSCNNDAISTIDTTTNKEHGAGDDDVNSSSTSRERLVRHATNLAEMHAAVGEDFYVILPCPSMVRGGGGGGGKGKTTSTFHNNSNSEDKEQQRSSFSDSQQRNRLLSPHECILEGTRLTLLSQQQQHSGSQEHLSTSPEGYEFTIRTPG